VKEFAKNDTQKVTETTLNDFWNF